MDVIGSLFSLGFIVGGIVNIVIPAKRLLEGDRSSGHDIYQRELSASGDEKRALAKAAFFYKAFGVVFIAIGAGLFYLSFYRLR